ncbi:MAG: ABC transporter ATP-binding protein [Gemmatimonadota bacterium]|nr:ABC transporter ATP-binding protein [Gemmatimonadota bacterium]
MNDDRDSHAIRTSGLTRDFPGVRAVDGLTLEVPRGAIFGFLGRNGAGKTTTIRLLLGLIESTEGEARVLGFDPATEAREIRRRSGVLLESAGLLERLTARQNLDLYGRIGRLPRPVRAARIQELLERIGLWERRDEPVKSWSRGMRQRLAIARALIHRPSLIFLDEPTAGLDPVSAAEVRDDLLRLAVRSRVTVFLTTHNLAEAERLCDRVAVVRRGRLLSVGAPAEIGTRNTLPRVRVRGRGLTPNVLSLLVERAEVAAVEDEAGGAVVSLADEGGVPRLVTFLVRLGVELEEVTPIGNTLEDGILSLFRQDPATAETPDLRLLGEAS